MLYRIDLAGGWLDQPYVSQHHPGSVIAVSIEPTIEFNERSGMATSTRCKAIDLWGPKLPAGDPYKLAKALFCYDNPPGTREISGAQDTIGIVFPGLARSDYDGEYWPHHIEHVADQETLQFVEDHVFLGLRDRDFAVLSDTHINDCNARRLAKAAHACWDAILQHDLVGFGTAVHESFDAQIAMFPHMCTPTVREMIDYYRDKTLGWKLSGAGGGGTLLSLRSPQSISKFAGAYGRNVYRDLAWKP